MAFRFRETLNKPTSSAKARRKDGEAGAQERRSRDGYDNTLPAGRRSRETTTERQTTINTSSVAMLYWILRRVAGFFMMLHSWFRALAIWISTVATVLLMVFIIGLLGITLGLWKSRVVLQLYKNATFGPVIGRTGWAYSDNTGSSSYSLLCNTPLLGKFCNKGFTSDEKWAPFTAFPKDHIEFHLDFTKLGESVVNVVPQAHLLFSTQVQVSHLASDILLIEEVPQRLLTASLYRNLSESLFTAGHCAGEMVLNINHFATSAAQRFRHLKSEVQAYRDQNFFFRLFTPSPEDLKPSFLHYLQTLIMQLKNLEAQTQQCITTFKGVKKDLKAVQQQQDINIEELQSILSSWWRILGRSNKQLALAKLQNEIGQHNFETGQKIAAVGEQLVLVKGLADQIYYASHDVHVVDIGYIVSGSLMAVAVAELEKVAAGIHNATMEENKRFKREAMARLSRRPTTETSEKSAR